MKPGEFKQCKEMCGYDDFMEVGLGFDHLSMDDYKDFMPVIFEVVPGMDN